MMVSVPYRAIIAKLGVFLCLVMLFGCSFCYGEETEKRFEVKNRQIIVVRIDHEGNKWCKEIFVLKDKKTGGEYLFFGQKKSTTTSGGSIPFTHTQYYIEFVTELKEKEDEKVPCHHNFNICNPTDH